MWNSSFTTLIPVPVKKEGFDPSLMRVAALMLLWTWTKTEPEPPPMTGRAYSNHTILMTLYDEVCPQHTGSHPAPVGGGNPALPKDHPEVKLRVGVPLVGAELVHPHCLGVVLRDPGAIRVPPAPGLSQRT